MLYICIPTHNEAETVGLVLWKVRKLFAEFPREYELLVYDDGSTDATAELLKPYADALPLTVLGGSGRVGYARAIDALVRAAVSRCRYPRRDAVLFMQADFTDQPAQIPDFVKKFEGGADIVVAEFAADAAPPVPVRRLRKVARWLTRRFVRVPGVSDPLGTFRLFRVSVLRDAVRAAGDKPVVDGEGWSVNVDLLLATIPHARRVETIVQSPRFDMRHRESRIRPWPDALKFFRHGRQSRAKHPPLRLAEPT